MAQRIKRWWRGFGNGLVHCVQIRVQNAVVTSEVKRDDEGLAPRVAQDFVIANARGAKPGPRGVGGSGRLSRVELRLLGIINMPLDAALIRAVLREVNIVAQNRNHFGVVVLIEGGFVPGDEAVRG